MIGNKNELIDLVKLGKLKNELFDVAKLKELKDFKCTSLDKIDEDKVLIIPIENKPAKVYIE